MSEIPPTDPLPSAAYSQEPPLASLASTVPPPPSPVPYVNPMDARSRPGLVTAIGVMSIVVACISALASLMFGGQALGLLMLSKMGSAMANTATVSNPGGYTSFTVVNAGTPPGNFASAAPSSAPSNANELPEAERSAVIAALTGAQTLTVERSAQLSRMLELHGRELFPDDGTALTLDSVQKLVKSKGSDAAGAEAYSWYVIPAGRITLFDESAVFAPVDGSTSFTTRADDAIAASASAVTTLNSQQVALIIARAQARVAGRINANQVATMQRELSAPNQQFIDPKLIWSPVQSVTESADGSVTILFSGNVFAGQGGGMMLIDKQGQLLSQSAATISTAGAGSQFPFANLNVSTWKVALAIIEDVLSIGLAIYLFVIGILILRQLPGGRRLHLFYAWLKLPLAVGGGIAMGWVYSRFLAIGPMGAAMSTGVILGGLVVGVVSCIYPIALIIALNSRSMREYFDVTPSR